MVPDLTEEAWPSLGGQVCQFIEEFLVFGPGDLRGEPARLDPEKRALIWRMYEVYPRDHPQAGRRRFKRVGISLRKGSAKSELAAWIAAVELHPDGPVRTVDWDGHGNPVGGGVMDPFIPMVAYTEEQSEELAYYALKTILEYSVLARDFDIGLERIMRIGGDGKALALANSPDARDGARTTLNVFDETHRLNLPRLKAAHRTMLANIPKRRIADAWSLEITTAPAPGEGSVAEDTMDYARQVADGKIADSRLFFFHRQAAENTKLYTDSGELDLAAVRAAVVEASGPVAEWSDIDGIVEQWRDPTADRAYLERVWLNRLVRASDRAFDAEKWRKLADPQYLPEPGAVITLGFDGARYRDSTGWIGCEVTTGHLFTLGIWEHPYGIVNWEVPASEVEDTLAAAMEGYTVWRAYCDPFYWETQVSEWAGRYEQVMEWRTNRRGPILAAVQAFNSAIAAGELTHDGDKQLSSHVGNAYRRYETAIDERGQKLWTICKERPDSPHKIDACMAAILAWEARGDALAAGVGEQRRSVYDERYERGEAGLVTV